MANILHFLVDMAAYICWLLRFDANYLPHFCLSMYDWVCEQNLK